MNSAARNDDSLVFEVMNGPSRDRIHNANMYAFDQNISIDLEFKVVFSKREKPAGGTTRKFMALKNVQILGVVHADRTGYDFDIQGTCDADVESPAGKCNTYRDFRFSMEYNSKLRTGTLRLKPIRFEDFF